MHKQFALVSISLLILLFFAAPAAADTVIVHTNDVHGHFADSIGYDGHSHTVLENGLQINNTLIVSTGCNLEHIGVVRIKDGKLSASLVSDYTKKDAEVSAVIKKYTDTVDERYGEKNRGIEGIPER